MNNERLHRTFLEMIRIESPSYHEAPMAAYCSRRLEQMGFDVRIDDTMSHTGSDTGNLIAHLPGTTPGHIAFSAHMDTVVPCTSIMAERVSIMLDEGETEVYRSQGETILSADDKAGIAAILEGIDAILEEGDPRPDLTVLLTIGEEQSLVGASALANDTLEGDVPCFVLDADGRPGSIIVGAPFHFTMEAIFHGRAAHAGVEPEAGISAIEAAAHAICAMPLERLDEVTTANIGPIEGGTATNIVADRCVLHGECRSIREERIRAQRDAMTRACEESAEGMGARVDIHWTEDYPGILFDEEDEMVQHLLRAAREIGLTPCCVFSGGGADANVLSRKGAKAITLGIGMTNFHSVDEYIRVQDLEDSARFVSAIIREYASVE